LYEVVALPRIFEGAVMVMVWVSTIFLPQPSRRPYDAFPALA
jgi:hypothetical protein